MSRTGRPLRQLTRSVNWPGTSPAPDFDLISGFPVALVVAGSIGNRARALVFEWNLTCAGEETQDMPQPNSASDKVECGL